jgi:hypothetical protein
MTPYAKCAHRFAATACLLTAFQGSANAQNPLPQPPLRSRTVLLIGGETRAVSLGRLEAGRRYDLRAEMVGQSDSAAGKVTVEGFATGSLPAVLDRDGFALDDGLTPESRDRFRVDLSGAGEIDSLYRVRITWRAEPEERMARVDYVPSPNQNRRQRGTITAIVVHATESATTESAVNWFLTPKSQVSAHYVVGRTGQIVQMVDDTQRAWHAGVSELDGATGVNEFSVGIEIVNLNNGKDPYTDAQYESVAAIIRHIREQYEVPDSRIVSHESVARPKGRKDDPMGFDFPRLLRLSRIEQ